MNVDPYLRASAAGQIVNALVAMDPAHTGEDQTDEAILLALGPVADSLREDEHVRAAIAAALDLLWFFTLRDAKAAGVERETHLARLRDLLPKLFPIPGDPNYD